MRSAVLAGSLLALACGTSRGPAASPDVLHVLSVRDSIGIELGPEEYMLGVFHMCALPCGDILLVDRVERTLDRFSAEGTHIASMQLSGSGPGEFMSPEMVTASPEGSFALWSPIDRKVAVFNREMVLSRELTLTRSGVTGPFRVCMVNDSTVVCSFQEFHGDSIRGVLSVHSTSLDSTDAVLMERSVSVYDPDADDLTRLFFDGSPSGTVWATFCDRHRWLLTELDPSGEELLVIEKEYEPDTYTITEIMHMRDIMTRRFTDAYGTHIGIPLEIPAYRLAMEDLLVDCSGRIWIMGGSMLDPSFLVLDRSGDSLFSCSFSAPRWQLVDQWRFTMDQGGSLAAPVNPEMFPVLYMVEPDTIQAGRT